MTTNQNSIQFIPMTCPSCGGNIPEEIRQGKLFKCNNCGSTLVWPDNQSSIGLSFGERICPNCGMENDQFHNYCRNCGTQLTKVCPSCRVIFYVGDNFCPNGHDSRHEQQTLEEENQNRTFSLSFLLGKNIRDKEIQTWMTNLGVSPEILKSEGYETDYMFKSKGVTLIFTSQDILRAIELYSEGAYEYRQFQGDLPFGLSFLSTHREVESILGRPDVIGGDTIEKLQCWVRYLSKGITISYNSNHEGDLDAFIYTISLSQISDDKPSSG